MDVGIHMMLLFSQDNNHVQANDRIHVTDDVELILVQADNPGS